MKLSKPKRCRKSPPVSVGGRCPHCGAKMVEYRFSFNKGLLAFLVKLYIANEPAKTDDLGLTYAQRTNSQKLRYWDLAVPYSGSEEAQNKRGWWVITDLGREFVEGRVSIKQQVVMYRNERVRFDGDDVMVFDVDRGYEYYLHYKEQASEQMKRKDR